MGSGGRDIRGHFMNRRALLLQFAGAAAVAPTFSRVGTAQTYPSHPITMIVPFPPGGSTDAIGRVLAERMRESLGQPIIIENVSGADGSIGMGRIARARPDGYTIEFFSPGGHVLNGALHALPFDVLNDFQPIVPLVAAPFVLFARKTMPANDLNELIAWLKANPGKTSVGTAASAAQLLTAFFRKETRTQFIIVPYRGTAPAMQDLVAGQIDLSFDLPPQLPLMRAGSIKAYGVTSDTRLAQAPEIPTFAEMGMPTVSYPGSFGLFAPKGTPKDITGKLNAAAVEALTHPAVRSRLTELGLDIVPRERQTPEALGALVKAATEKWWPIIKDLGIRAE
jgi:tripartite-type tricarboxylate transporter receptor subunit TctC